jgi:hypothetical protein
MGNGAAKPRLKSTIIAAGVFVCFLGVLLLSLLLSGPQPSKLKLLSAQDKAFQLTFSTITHGTNHVVFRGNSAAAWIKWELSHSRFQSFGTWFPSWIHADVYERPTQNSADVLWIGWTTTDTNFHPFNLPGCTLTDSSGQTKMLPPLSATVRSKPDRMHYVQSFGLPTNLTSYKGYTLRIQYFNSGGEADVARLQLQ